MRILTIQPSPYGSAFTRSGSVVQALVELEHLAADGQKSVRHGLHRLDRSENVVLRQRLAHRRHVDENDIAQLALREVGNPDIRLVAFHANPLVVFRILQMIRYVIRIMAFLIWKPVVSELKGRTFLRNRETNCELFNTKTQRRASASLSHAIRSSTGS